MNKTINFVFGPNASGKGTLARHLSEKLGYYHLIASDALKAWASVNRRYDILNTMDQGEFVDDNITFAALEAKFEQIGHLADIIIDGYPRKLSQMNMMRKLCEKYGFKPNFMIILNVPLEVIVDRVKDRVVAPDGHVYHMTLNPPPKHFKMSELVPRPDDAPEIVKKRYEFYVTHTLEVISDPFFKDVKVCSIDATQSIPTVYAEAEEFIKSLNR